ncbi:unnamed protein product [Staurois parvus]|uniref:NADH dehydrogenase subunit 2 n=1 Tax=Staurois parvus TaxID=386267 RepID=A0ABN9G2L3_9NEOB|nr:unnamed protein product [Staurois parvus]
MAVYILEFIYFIFYTSNGGDQRPIAELTATDIPKLIIVLVSLGMSATPSQFPPVLD